MLKSLLSAIPESAGFHLMACAVILCSLAVLSMIVAAAMGAWGWLAAFAIVAVLAGGMGVVLCGAVKVP